MTPTSDERREVARAMQDWADRYPQGDFSWGVLGSVHYRIDGADARPSSNQEVLYMLADLIDPTCAMEYGGYLPESVKGMLGVYFCSECGSPIYNDVEPAYCPYCGARVVSGDGE